MPLSSSPPATILCVEDEPSQLTLRKLLMESQGYNVITAESGQEALKQFQTNSVDLAILDYWMPRPNGMAVARQMKKLKPNVPIIIFSASQSSPHLSRYREKQSEFRTCGCEKRKQNLQICCTQLKDY